jgi:IPT/TIG domain
MKNTKVYIAAAIVFLALVGLAMALTPPPPPPPPVGQNLGLYDTGIDHLQTTAIDQSACRQCHQTSGTNISQGYNNTIGGVPTRHHSLVARAVKNPITGANFACQDCHPSTPGIGSGILLDRSCVDCHNGTSFSNSGARVGNFSRPHHINTSYTSVAGFGNPAADRQCNKCHGSFVGNYNDSHYKPAYDTSLMITPFATFKVTNFSQPDGLGGNKVWGGCLSCHAANPAGSPSAIDSNHDTHHKEILGLGRFGGQTSFQNASTPFDLTGAPGGRSCFVCHVVAPSGSPARFNMTNEFTGELLVNAMELRNSTIEATSAIEPGTTNITFNGTGCQKCHSVQSIHNIQFNYVQNGQQGLGHINNDMDCSGCHDEWLPATDFVPGALVPYVDSVSPAVLTANTATTLTIAGSNFVNGVYTSVVSVDGVTYNPSSITDTEIVVDIPALSAGSHELQIVKNGDTLSKLSTLVVVPVVTLSSASLDGTTLTLTGTGLGSMPATTPEQYVVVGSAGYAASVASWTDTQIVATVSGTVAADDVVTVITADAGEAKAAVSIVAPAIDSVTVTYPNAAGLTWKRGTSKTVTWDRAGPHQAANVRIELVSPTKGTKVLKSSTTNDGSQSVSISSSQATASDYTIRITSLSHTPTYSDSSDNTFSVTR